MRKLPIVLMGSSLLFGCGISRQEVVKKDNEITSLRGQLTEERNKVKALEERLDTLIPPPPNQAISIKEICAVPDMYVGKEITIKGPLVQPVVFNEPITNFRLFNRGCYVFCAFITKELDPKTRRELASLNGRENVNLSGRLVQNKDGLLKNIAITGYHFIVTKVSLEK